MASKDFEMQLSCRAKLSLIYLCMSCLPRHMLYCAANLSASTSFKWAKINIPRGKDLIRKSRTIPL